MTDTGWQWDPSLYEGSAAHYVRGRVPYTTALVDALVTALALDGTGQLLDMGCGPGSLTLPLAPWFARTTGIDADADMLRVAAQHAAAAGIENVDWLHLRAEDLPADVGPFRVVTLAQSFHWMDRPRVAGLLHGVLEPEGVLVHVHAVTDHGIDEGAELPFPRPPWPEIHGLVSSFLGPERRAGKGPLPASWLETSEIGSVETPVYRAAGFVHRTRLVVPGDVVVRSRDQLVASVLSLSSAAPHLFGERLPDFTGRLQRLLSEVSPDGRFSEQMRDTVVDVWRTRRPRDRTA